VIVSNEFYSCLLHRFINPQNAIPSLSSATPARLPHLKFSSHQTPKSSNLLPELWCSPFLTPIKISLFSCQQPRIQTQSDRISPVSTMPVVCRFDLGSSLKNRTPSWSLVGLGLVSHHFDKLLGIKHLFSGILESPLEVYFWLWASWDLFLYIKARLRSRILSHTHFIFFRLYYIMFTRMIWIVFALNLDIWYKLIY